METRRYRKKYNILCWWIFYSYDADGIVLITEWNQFRGMNLKNVRERMKDNFYFDLRNVYVKDSNVRKIFKYYPIGQE